MKILKYFGYLIAFGIIALGAMYLYFDINIFSVSKNTFHDTFNFDELTKPIFEKDELSIVMVGDVLIHSPVYNSAYVGDGIYDFRYMFENIKPIAESYDLAFYNQESIIGGKELGLSSYPRFNSPEEIGDAMLDAGFNLVSLANNHTLDKGETGVLNSLLYWSDKDVMTSGSYNSDESREEIQMGEMNGFTYTLLSYTTLTNGLSAPSGKEYLVNVYSDEKATADIEKVRDKVDIVMVSIHWGQEYTHSPVKEQIEIANHLADLNVDIVIGHHPHVLEPVTYIDDTLVIYSLGNFISSQIGIDRLVGAMVTIEFRKYKNDYYEEMIMDKPEVILTYNHYPSSRDNFKIYTFDQLDNSILSGYESKYTEYSNVIKSMDDTMMVSSLGE